jgi:hypothetical protein
MAITAIFAVIVLLPVREKYSRWQHDVDATAAASAAASPVFAGAANSSTSQQEDLA